jgi:hypothetical protein
LHLHSKERFATHLDNAAPPRLLGKKPLSPNLEGQRGAPGGLKNLEGTNTAADREADLKKGGHGSRMCHGLSEQRAPVAEEHRRMVDMANGRRQHRCNVHPAQARAAAPVLGDLYRISRHDVQHTIRAGIYPAEALEKVDDDPFFSNLPQEDTFRILLPYDQVAAVGNWKPHCLRDANGRSMPKALCLAYGQMDS